MDIPKNIIPYWEKFIKTRNKKAASKFYEVFHFTMDKNSANQLAELVLQGKKRATSSLYWDYDSSDELPKKNYFSIVTNWDGIPLCIIETIKVDIIPYNEVSKEFAAMEGEGDCSLDYWRRIHWDSFTKSCAYIGRLPEKNMPIVCEQFKLVYK
ncbi:MAG TPA: ASCH domain-containing protein [Victivallales bacterium]|nr:ASCH domain-containing protein [Victivallales bacterium]